ncbi:MAG: hypothetical protein DMF60_07825 [Acidobacteria bacterium]|nr:MAG: hypothetical protein DMF60_07825 [Acidobacteriota bacterium]
MRPNCLAIVVFSAALAITGCHKRVPVTALPPASTPASVAAAPVASALDQADRAFSSGSYDEAARDYENYLRDFIWA